MTLFVGDTFLYEAVKAFLEHIFEDVLFFRNPTVPRWNSCLKTRRAAARKRTRCGNQRTRLDSLYESTLLSDASTYQLITPPLLHTLSPFSLSFSNNRRSIVPDSSERHRFPYSIITRLRSPRSSATSVYPLNRNSSSPDLSPTVKSIFESPLCTRLSFDSWHPPLNDRTLSPPTGTRVRSNARGGWSKESVAGPSAGGPFNPDVLQPSGTASRPEARRALPRVPPLRSTPPGDGVFHRLSRASSAGGHRVK